MHFAQVCYIAGQNILSPTVRVCVCVSDVECERSTKTWRHTVASRKEHTHRLRTRFKSETWQNKISEPAVTRGPLSRHSSLAGCPTPVSPLDSGYESYAAGRVSGQDGVGGSGRTHRRRWRGQRTGWPDTAAGRRRVGTGRSTRSKDRPLQLSQPIADRYTLSPNPHSTTRARTPLFLFRPSVSDVVVPLTHSRGPQWVAAIPDALSLPPSSKHSTTHHPLCPHLSSALISSASPASSFPCAPHTMPLPSSSFLSPSPFRPFRLLLELSISGWRKRQQGD